MTQDKINDYSRWCFNAQLRSAPWWAAVATARRHSSTLNNSFGFRCDVTTHCVQWMLVCGLSGLKCTH